MTREQLFKLFRRSPEQFTRRMITVAVAQVRYDINPSTLRKWLRQGKVDGYRFPNSYWLVDRQSLEKYLEGRR